MKLAKRHLAFRVLRPLMTVVACSTVYAQTSPVPFIHQPVIQARLADAYGKLPLSFEANHGQTDRQVKFLSRVSGYSLFLTGNGAVLALKKGNRELEQSPEVLPAPGKHSSPETTDFLRMSLIGANPVVRVSGVDELAGKSNYFVGNDPAKWQTNVPTYAKVKYEEVYPGINLIYYGNQRQLEYDFVVAPGADPKGIRLRFHGAKKLRIDEQGALVLQTQRGEARFDPPKVYQDIGRDKLIVTGRYKLVATSTVIFELGAYEKAKPLVIDPTLAFSTFLGGSGDDMAESVSVDSIGNIYVTGITGSANFPLQSPFQSSPIFNVCGTPPNTFTCTLAFVTKFNSTATSLIYSTFIAGANGYESARSIAVDSNENAYVYGDTTSSDFPTTPGAFSTSFVAGQCGTGSSVVYPCREAFLTRFNSSGSALAYSTYLGSVGDTVGAGPHGIAVDNLGRAFVTGSTSSTSFPTTAGAFQTTCIYSGPFTPCSKVFVSVLNPAGSALVYSTYLGGTGYDAGNALAVDAAGSAIVTGTTGSSDFPLVNPLQTSPANTFFAKLKPDGSGLIYSSYLGGSNQVVPEGLAIDIDDNVFIGGWTSGTNFPTTHGAFQATAPNVNGYSGFVSKIDKSGGSYVYSTYLGGVSGSNPFTYISDIAVDSLGQAYVAGFTTQAGFPQVNSILPNFVGGTCSNPGHLQCAHAFVSEFNAAGSALLFSTYLGGNNVDSASSLAVDQFQSIYVVGGTNSSDFPTANAFQSVLQSGTCINGPCEDAFLTKLQPPSLIASPASLTFPPQPVSSSSPTQIVTVTNFNAQPQQVVSVTVSGDFSETDNCVGSVPAGASCSINVTFTPPATGNRLGSLNIANNLSGSLVAVPLTGTGIAATRIVSLSTSSLTFTNQMVGLTSQAQGITLSNVGNSALAISGLAFSGTNATEFAETDNCSGSVAVGAICTINVTFMPTATGTRTGALNIMDNATSPQSPQTVALTGTGFPSAPIVSLSSTSVAFPTQTIGSASGAQTVILHNVGAAILNIQAVVLAGSNPNDFAIASGSTCANGSTVAPNSSCVIQLTFTPAALGTRSATVGITDNAADSPETIGLSGMTTPTPLVSVTPSNITFTGQYVGTSGLPQSVTVTNNGNAPLSIASVTVSPADFGILNACGSTVAVGTSCAVGVFFDPTASGTRPGTLTINDNAPGSSQTVALSGTGQDFSLAPTSSASAAVSPGQTANFGVAVTPAGDFNQLVALTCSGAPALSTCAVSPNSVVLNGSAAATINVTVTTTAASFVVREPGGSSPSARSGYRPAFLITELLGFSLLSGLCGLLIWRRDRRPRLAYGLVLLLFLCAGVMMSACGSGSSGGGGNPGTLAGTYTLVVSGSFTSGSTTLTRKSNLTLVVQ